MSYKLKTLIVFDTNSLRSTEAGKVAYSFFAFGKPFQVIETFVQENELTDDIHLAIPTWAIEELKRQKQKQYNDDLGELHKLTTRLSGLPHIPEIVIPEGVFDCATYVEEKAREFLLEKQVKLLEVKEGMGDAVLQSMLSRVNRNGEEAKPFYIHKSNKKTYRDAGFMDNVIWESLLQFDGLTNYDKIIFITADGDFNKYCETEFKQKWKKHILITGDENTALADIKKDYDNYIKERDIHDFAQTEYFIDYLHDDLAYKSNLVIEGMEYAIENFKIVDPCQLVERLPQDEEGSESRVIHSAIKVFYSNGGEKKEQDVIAYTTLFDEMTKDIDSTEYDIELR